jgi:hypothetical protein
MRFGTAVMAGNGQGEVRCGWVRQSRLVEETLGWEWIGSVRQEFAKARRGRDACGMFRQSGNGRDVIGLDGCVLARQSRQGAGGFV